VGAGPAGSTTARYAARRGLSVLLIDRRKVIGVPVQCGEYVASNSEMEEIFPGIADMADLMEAPYSVKFIDMEKIRIISPGGREYLLPFRGFTVDRALMDQAIAAQAVEEGAELMTKVTALDIKGNKVVTTKGEFEGRVIVGADGPFSRVAKSVGLEWPVSSPAMSATLEGKFSNTCDMYFGNLAPGGYAWVIPKGDAANVGVGVWPRFKGKLDVPFQAFLRKIQLPSVRGTGGYVPIMGPVPRTVKGNVVLVGDAAGHVMPPNGGGINTGMICGRIAGETIHEHLMKGTSLSDYEVRWRALVGKALARGVKIRKLAGHFFGSDRSLERAMRFLGPKRMGRAIRCQRLFFAR
jgi:digeranylgeranylglycerophospholipid reductase